MRQVIIFLLSSIFLVSCLDEFQKDLDKIAEPEWNPTFGLPFLSGTFTMEDYVDATSEDIIVTQTPEGLITIEYSGDEITSDYAQDLIEVPTQSFNKSLNLNNIPPGIPINGEFTVNQNFDSDITPEPGSTDIIDSVLLKAGTLVLEIETNVAAAGLLDLTINTFTKDGELISYRAGWNANSGAQTIVENIDLAGAFGDFTRNGSATNNFNFDAEATLTFSGQSLSPTDYIRINIEVIDPKFQLVYGKFSEREFETELETVSLGIFDEVTIEGFYLDQPRVEFNFISSYGVPVEASILTLDAINSDGQVLPFSGSAISDPTQVIGPSLEEIGSTVETSLVIDKSNSNITDIISFLPSELNYEFAGRVISPSPTATQFVLDTSRVIGNYKIVLPLDGRVARFESEQDIEIGSGNQDIDNLGKSKISVRSLNGLPITVGLEIIFYDEFDNEVLTLFKDEAVLESGLTDADGFVVSPTENNLEQELTATEVQELLNADRAVIRTILNTGDDGTEIVKFRMTDEVRIALYLQTSLDF
jgi:hypothetical protein